MEPVEAIPAHLADNFITLMGFFSSNGDLC